MLYCFLDQLQVMNLEYCCCLDVCSLWICFFLYIGLLFCICYRGYWWEEIEQKCRYVLDFVKYSLYNNFYNI